MSRLVLAQLTATSPPGLLAPWAHRRGTALELVRPDLGETLPPAQEADGVIITGTDASLRDAWLSWLPGVRAWAAEALARDVPVLGIGLGAQIVASILGADVARAPEPEAGWTRVQGDDPGVARGPWLAYGEDMIASPFGPWTTADNDRGTQVFRTGPHMGVQFHAHATPDMVRGWESGGRFAVGADLAAQVSEEIAGLARDAGALFNSWAEQAGLPSGTAELATV